MKRLLALGITASLTFALTACSSTEPVTPETTTATAVPSQPAPEPTESAPEAVKPEPVEVVAPEPKPLTVTEAYCAFNDEIADDNIAAATAATTGEYAQTMREVFTQMREVEAPKEIAKAWKVNMSMTADSIRYMESLNPETPLWEAQQDFLMDELGVEGYEANLASAEALMAFNDSEC